MKTSKRARATRPRSKTFIVYGLDDQNKPHAATFVGVDPEAITKAVASDDCQICEASSTLLKQAAVKLPDGRIDAKGRASIPHIDTTLYRLLFDALVQMPKNSNDQTRVMPTGLPSDWKDIGPGHLVITQETLEYGWWEAVVMTRKGASLRLQYRDYPHLPKFTRQVTDVALLATAPALQPLTSQEPLP